MDERADGTSTSVDTGGGGLRRPLPFSAEERRHESVRVERDQIADLLPYPDESDGNLQRVLDGEDDPALPPPPGQTGGDPQPGLGCQDQPPLRPWIRVCQGGCRQADRVVEGLCL